MHRVTDIYITIHHGFGILVAVFGKIFILFFDGLGFVFLIYFIVISGNFFFFLLSHICLYFERVIVLCLQCIAI